MTMWYICVGSSSNMCNMSIYVLSRINVYGGVASVMCIIILIASINDVYVYYGSGY